MVRVTIDQQNNTIARASHFLVHFFVVTARLQPYFKFHEGPKQAATKFSFFF